MSQRLFGRTSGANQDEQWEVRLRNIARSFPYPPTPDLTSAVKAQLTSGEAGSRSGFLSIKMSRRLVWAALCLILILGGLLAVPQVRAALVEYLQIGAVRIFMVEPTPSPTSLPSTTAPELPTVTPRPSPTPLASLLDLAGETTLAEAEKQAGFSIRLPVYRADLGPPDRVFFQDLGGPVVVLVWLDPDRPDQVRFSLQELGPGTFAEKGNPGLVRETLVNGQQAIWAEGPYLLQFRRGNSLEYDLRRLVDGHVLIWAEGKVTYRLESNLSLEEAINVAESLH